MKIIFKLTFTFFLFMSFTGFLGAQIPNDLSTIKANQITDAQLQQYVQKAAESGMSQAQIEQELTKKGLSASEMTILRARISAFSTTSNNSGGGITDRSRIYNQDTSKPFVPNIKTISPNSVFGSEFFSGASSVFEPNLKIATPQNYIIGPDDELLLDVSGVNVSQQKLKVSLEGTVELKYAGAINVNGLSIEQASKKITQKLQQYYPSISSGQTRVTISLGNIRSIKVILIGAVNKPGTFSLPSLATLYNALYQSGGPTSNGSFRNIELIRNSNVIAVADFYDFLTKGDLRGNVRLQDNDIIRIPYVKLKVTLFGEVNRPGIFELKANESLDNLINYAGGYTINAYKARIIGARITDVDKQIIEIVKDSTIFYKPQNGDLFQVNSIIDKFQNRITIGGAVFKPGLYSYTEGMTLQQLIGKAAGLKEDAFSKRIVITRTKSDLTKEYITTSFTPNNSVIDTSLKLAKEDVVQVTSIFDVKEQFIVSINGGIHKPGNYNFEDSLSLKTLILLAGGFTDNATGKALEISRRKRDVNPNDPTSAIAEIITIDIDKELAQKSFDIQLKPFDIISIKLDPSYRSQINVSIEGEVLSPGTFTLQSRDERISSLIKRAGGTLYPANVSGARLKRLNNPKDVDLKIVKKIAQSSAKDSTNITLEEEMNPYVDVAIDLPKILANPGGKEDILLIEGDNIIVPKIDNMVSVSGEVFKPISVSFDDVKSLKNYLSDAGGITASANKKRLFVIYPNGRASKIKHPLLFFRKYPQITAGTKIFVPRMPDRKAIDFAKASAIASAFVGLTTSLILIYQFTK